MPPTIEIAIADGVKVVVPDSLDLITPYVLMEQQDWFEDEIKFLRRLLQTGHKTIDIGANYGVYALSMAQRVGPTGCVWAFEPASSTARLLADGVAANDFSQIVIERSALSSSSGTGQMSVNEHAELNALVHSDRISTASETVPVVTLDECMNRHRWLEIEFIKIDAEGEEANILKGGSRFFLELSPLVQYEVKAGDRLHLELVHDFAALGYVSYRLIPGLDLLVPFEDKSVPDSYLLNLFCCKRDRAELLAASGRLLKPAVHLNVAATGELKDHSGRVGHKEKYGWRQTIAKLPYGMQLAERWQQTMAAGNSVEVDEALSQYALSRDSALSAAARFSALEASFGLLKNICDREPSYLRLASLARVARDYGARSLAVDALIFLSDDILRRNRVHTSEPFLAPGERFDFIAPGAAMGNWVLAATLEELERLEFFSSFYNDPAVNRKRLENIHALGFGSAEMERRLQLLRKRFRLSAA